MSDIQTWDATAANNNSTPPDGFPENMNYSQVNDAARELMASNKRWYSDTNGTIVTAGVSPVHTIATNRTITAYEDGLVFTIEIGNTYSANPQLNVNSIGAVSLQHPDGSLVEGTELVQGGVYTVVYKGGVFILLGEKNRLPKDYYTGFPLSSSTDADHDITIGTGSARDSSNVFDLFSTSNITKQIDAAHADGNNAGGLFSGGVAADTTYYLFILGKADGTIDAGFDINTSATNKPVDWIYHRLVGTVETDASANIKPTAINGVEAVTQSDLSPSLSGRELIDFNDDMSGASSHDITVSGTYSKIEIVFGGVSVTGSASNLDLRVGSSAVDSGVNYFYGLNQNGSNVGLSSQDSIVLCTANTSYDVGGKVEILDFSDSGRRPTTHGSAITSSSSASATNTFWLSAGSYTQASALDIIQISSDTGANFASGNYQVYGYK